MIREQIAAHYDMQSDKQSTRQLGVLLST